MLERKDIIDFSESLEEFYIGEEDDLCMLSRYHKENYMIYLMGEYYNIQEADNLGLNICGLLIHFEIIEQ